ncbi:putative pentatricopeptide repeat-containing protein-like [Capsicum annuum]|nr:putative pentatricopeptide repeat-containing protein-like [Capsicum annuum]
MKKSGILAASVSAVAISTTTTTTNTTSSKVRISLHKDKNLKKKDENYSSKPVKASTSSDKFAPRFDGLKFIETLVTAHR